MHHWRSYARMKLCACMVWTWICAHCACSKTHFHLSRPILSMKWLIHCINVCILPSRMGARLDFQYILFCFILFLSILLFQPCVPKQILIQPMQAFSDIPICSSGRVQVQRRNIQLQKFSGEIWGLIHTICNHKEKKMFVFFFRDTIISDRRLLKIKLTRSWNCMIRRKMVQIKYYKWKDSYNADLWYATTRMLNSFTAISDNNRFLQTA